MVVAGCVICGFGSICLFIVFALVGCGFVFCFRFLGFLLTGSLAFALFCGCLLRLR